MYLRRCRRTRGDKQHVYWQLVESYRTERGARQRTVAYLGDVAEPIREGVAAAAREETGIYQPSLLSEDVSPEWVEVDSAHVWVERVLDFGVYWLGLEMMRELGLPDFLEDLMGRGREEVPWPLMAMVLVLMRLAHVFVHREWPTLIIGNGPPWWVS